MDEKDDDVDEEDNDDNDDNEECEDKDDISSSIAAVITTHSIFDQTRPTLLTELRDRL